MNLYLKNKQTNKHTIHYLSAFGFLNEFKTICFMLQMTSADTEVGR